MTVPACDLLVVGSGAAGLTAAITAERGGLKPLIVEKETVWGGTTAVSGGAVWCPTNHIAMARGHQDSLADAKTYLTADCGNRMDHPLVDAFLEAAPKAIRFLEENSALRFVAPRVYPDYHPDLPGAATGGRLLRPATFDGRELGRHFRTLQWPLKEMMLFGGLAITPEDLPHMMRVTKSLRSALYVGAMVAGFVRDRLSAPRGYALANGNALAGRLGKTVFERDIPLWLNTKVTRLLVEQGRVVGAEVERNGEAMTIRAARGVVLAAGGYGRDPEFRRQFYPHVAAGAEHHTLVPPGPTGDGLRLAETAGGALRTNGSDGAVWVPVSRLDRGNGETVTVAHLFDRAKPGFIAVDPQGRRFTNESASYQDFVPALVAASKKAGATDGHAWLILDHRALRAYGVGAVRPTPLPYAHFIGAGYLHWGRTVSELAQRIGIDPAVLEQTVQRFNVHAVRGKDPEFGKGGNAYERFMGDAAHQPNPCIAPLNNGPFYAVRIYPGDVGTFHGIRIDANARVVDGDGVAVPGLYAAGNDAASIFGGAYPGGGTTLGPALAFGWLAGRHAAQAA